MRPRRERRPASGPGSTQCNWARAQCPCRPPCLHRARHGPRHRHCLVDRRHRLQQGYLPGCVARQSTGKVKADTPSRTGWGTHVLGWHTPLQRRQLGLLAHAPVQPPRLWMPCSLVWPAWLAVARMLAALPCPALCLTSSVPTRSWVGFSPTTPQAAAGMRMLPPPSVPAAGAASGQEGQGIDYVYDMDNRNIISLARGRPQAAAGHPLSCNLLLKLQPPCTTAPRPTHPRRWGRCQRQAGPHCRCCCRPCGAPDCGGCARCRSQC